MNKRLDLLETMVKSGSADSFALYALALEYRKENRADAAIETFTTLRARDPDYLPMYLMAGQVFVAASRFAEALDWLEAGIQLARAKADSKALGELEAELSNAKSLSGG